MKYPETDVDYVGVMRLYSDGIRSAFPVKPAQGMSMYGIWVACGWCTRPVFVTRARSILLEMKSPLPQWFDLKLIVPVVR